MADVSSSNGELPAAPTDNTKPSEPNNAPPVATTTDQRSAQSNGQPTSETIPDGAPVAAAAPSEPLSKNQQKKLKRKQQWEDGREDRKRKRKAARINQRERRREERRAKMAEAEAAGLDPEEVIRAEKAKRERVRNPVPVAFIVDCDFEQYMLENELISLASQITRCYADNRAGHYQAHLYMSSWKGKMKERFDGVLSGQYKRWQDFHVTEEDFVEAAKDAHAVMLGPNGGAIQGALAGASGPNEARTDANEADAAPVAEAAPPIPTEPSVVYLTSDSPHTLERLEPYTSYVIGGIVDRNREKRLCFNRAVKRGVRTAKLPIGEYMVMASRQVLTTNQVVDIMSKWLQHGSWADAFTAVMPKRKGGQLRSALDSAEGETPQCDGDGDEGEGEEDLEDDGEPNGEDDMVGEAGEGAGDGAQAGQAAAEMPV